MRTAVITDTNSGISTKEAAEMGIRSIPMPVLIEGEIYYEGVDLESDTFYASLTEGKAVTTSQPSPGVVCSAWEAALDEGFDSVVYLPMSSGLSHSCESAQLLTANYAGRVAVVDNGRVSVTLRAAVEDALAMANQGIPAAHIKSELERRAKLSSIYLAVDDLQFLVRGGRVTPAAAALASVLKVRPVLSIRTGKIEPFSKERGMKKAVAKMFSAAKHDAKKEFDLKADDLVVGVATAGVAPERELEYLEQAKAEFPDATVVFNRLPFSVAVHTGPGAMGVGIHARPKQLTAQDSLATEQANEQDLKQAGKQTARSKQNEQPVSSEQGV